MKKALLALTAVFALEGAYANEVGAMNPETDTTAQWVVAAWDAGASKTSWAFEPTDSIASHKTMQEFESRVTNLNVRVNEQIGNVLEQKLDALLAEHL